MTVFYYLLLWHHMVIAWCIKGCEATAAVDVDCFLHSKNLRSQAEGHREIARQKDFYIKGFCFSDYVSRWIYNEEVNKKFAVLVYLEIRTVVKKNWYVLQKWDVHAGLCRAGCSTNYFCLNSNIIFLIVFRNTLWKTAWLWTSCWRCLSPGSKRRALPVLQLP